MAYYRDTWAEIDLDAIVHNVGVIKQMHPNKAIFAVVKANGYGHGDVEVSKAALEGGAEVMAVSALDEALNLRTHGLEGPILVLGATRLKDVHLAALYDISLTAHDEEWVEMLQYIPLDVPLKIHLKVDTGMHRLGLTVNQDIKKNYDLLKKMPMVTLEGLYTHMATADSDLGYLEEQLAQFRELLDSLDLEGLRYVHVENTATLLQFDFDFDQGIRLGIGMYGINPDPDFIPLEADLRPALKLYSHLTQVKMIHPGDKVGYGITYEAEEEEWIGIVPIGYADGWTRGHQGRHVIVEGHECEIVGRICMDQMMIRLPGKFPMGTRVTLIGDGMPVERVAREMETIPYETLCLISDRVPRIYVRNNEVTTIRLMRFDQI